MVINLISQDLGGWDEASKKGTFGVIFRERVQKGRTGWDHEGYTGTYITVHGRRTLDSLFDRKGTISRGLENRSGLIILLDGNFCILIIK